MQFIQESERTAVIKDWQEILDKAMNFFLNARSRIDICAVTITPQQPEPIKGMTDAYFGLLKKGGRLRLLTEINRDNITYCQQVTSQGVEIRHIEGIAGNFAVSDSEYLASLQTDEFNPKGPILFSNETIFVKHHQALFDMLWNHSIPSDRRYAEIEIGVSPGKFELLYASDKMREISFQMIQSARREILIMFPTQNSFRRQRESTFLDVLRQMARQGLSVRILTATDDDIEGTIALERQMSKIEFQRIAPEFGMHQSGLIVVDREESLTMEITNDSGLDFASAMGIGVFCTSTPTVLSNSAFFERLWQDNALVEELARRRNQNPEGTIVSPLPWEITPFSFRCIRCGRKVEKEIRIYEPEAMPPLSMSVSRAMKSADAGWIPFCYDCISRHPMLKPSWLTTLPK